eukprot:jgi/Chrzof1/13709/Cz08g09030.t1
MTDSETEHHVTGADLPLNFLQSVVETLDLTDVINASMTCKLWHRASLGVWQSLGQKRWTRWQTPPPPGAGHQVWKSEYARRHKIDKDLLPTLNNACWLNLREACFRQTWTWGWDVFEALAKTAADDSNMAVGASFWARTSLQHFASYKCVSKIHHMLSDPNFGEDQILQGALVLAELYHPLSDVSAVQTFVDSLAQELKRRMQDAEVAGGVEALRLLNQLMFSPPDALDAAPAGEATTSTTAAPTSESGAYARRTSSDVDAAAATADDADVAGMTGPDLSHLRVPAAGLGLGLQGDEADYYNASNSLLDDVLIRRRGIPISLAVLYMALGRAAGLPVQLVGVPLHVVTKMGEPGASDERFVDVYNKGAMYTREDMSAFMLDLGVAPLPQHLEPLKPAAVYFRMCSNLLNTQLSTSEDRVTSLVRLMAALQPRNHNALELQLKVCADRGFLEEAEGLLGKLANLHAPSSQQIQMLRYHIERGKKHLDSETSQVWRASQHPAVKYRVGDIIQHKRYNYRGVIRGWDASCEASQLWIMQMKVDSLPLGRTQPFYQVLVDAKGQEQSTYVAQENITLLSAVQPRLNTVDDISSTQRSTASGQEASSSTSADASRAAGSLRHAAAAGTDYTTYCNRAALQPVHHPHVGRYFASLVPDGAGGRYIPNTFLQYQYPDDLQRSP